MIDPQSYLARFTVRETKPRKPNQAFETIQEICGYFNVDPYKHQGFLYGIYRRVGRHEMIKKLTEVGKEKGIRYYGATFRKKEQ